MDPGIVVLGEVGLAGEVRAVSQVEARLAEAAKMGFTVAVVPEGNRARLVGEPPILVRGVKTLEEALEATLRGRVIRRSGIDPMAVGGLGSWFPWAPTPRPTPPRARLADPTSAGTPGPGSRFWCSTASTPSRTSCRSTAPTSASGGCSSGPRTRGRWARQIYLQFALKDGSSLIEGLGRVVHVNEAGGEGEAGMGIEFESFDDESRKFIEELVASRLAEGGGAA